LCIAAMAAGGSGSVTSPMPQRIRRLAASGFASQKHAAFHAPADFGKKVAGFEFQIIVVEKCHMRLAPKIFERRGHLPHQPVGFRLVAEMLRQREFLPVARADFQVIICRMSHGRADFRREIRHVSRFDHVLFFELEPGQFQFLPVRPQSRHGCGEARGSKKSASANRQRRRRAAKAAARECKSKR
jgi:hypothetical protein